VQQKTIAIVGFGDLGERLSSLLLAPKWRCFGLRRNAGAVPAGVEGIAIDLQDAPSLRVLERLQPHALVIALSPQDRSAAGYKAGFADAMTGIVSGLGEHRPERAFFVSAEASGAWINEDSPTAGQDPHVMAILSAERQFLDAMDGGVVLRAGGLYGQGPGPLLKRVAAGKLTPAAPLRYANRIHRDDVAGFMAFGLEDTARLAAPIINLVDDVPAPLQETEAWLCAQLSQPYEPPALESAPMDVAHKRIANAWLHASGYTLQYPDYRAGYGAVIQRWMAHSEREDGLDLH
jgi:hypothetical protein